MAQYTRGDPQIEVVGFSFLLFEEGRSLSGVLSSLDKILWYKVRIKITRC